MEFRYQTEELKEELDKANGKSHLKIKQNKLLSLCKLHY